jgi:hypothetical protein
MIIRNPGSKEFQACGWPIPAHRAFRRGASTCKSRVKIFRRVQN